MDLSLDVQVADDNHDHPPPAQFKQWVSATIGDRLSSAQLGVRLVTEAEMINLNTIYRGQNRATNVLSFAAQLPTYINIPLLGDLVICSSVVEREAVEQHKTCHSHWAHMVIHGTLHLLGYDHIEDKEAQTMENLEIDILNSLGIANPYHAIHY